ncbi:MAG: hypothetical protein WAW13_01525 [Minisyncoccia bacterium]
MHVLPHKKLPPRFVTTEKLVGETPLVSLEKVREKLKLSSTVPLAYAGRLDPMASGKLLILIGDECKVQEKYHSFDKEYEVEVLLGVASDSGDVLGIVHSKGQNVEVSEELVQKVLRQNVGKVSLPYPHFSSKTVKGKPLHTWALEKRLHEIEIPVKESRIYKIIYTGLRTIPKQEILKIVREKIETIPPVTDEWKALGADFRRDVVRDAWNAIQQNTQESYQVLSFTCTASSGSYMRSLSEKIAKELGTIGLAYSIHRTHIGKYFPLTKTRGFWTKKF